VLLSWKSPFYHVKPSQYFSASFRFVMCKAMWLSLRKS